MSKLMINRYDKLLAAARKPAAVQRWLIDGKHHRTDGPAIEYDNGDKFWLINDKYHRTDGPAVEYAYGEKRWYINNKLHRTDGPAIEDADGNKFWLINDKYHRTDGPAIEYADGSKCWYINGKQLTEQEFNNLTVDQGTILEDNRLNKHRRMI